MAKYVLAISGGIDSMALLDLVANDYDGFRRQYFASAKWPNDFVVAHFTLTTVFEVMNRTTMRNSSGPLFGNAMGCSFRLGAGSCPPIPAKRWLGGLAINS